MGKLDQFVTESHLSLGDILPDNYKLKRAKNNNDYLLYLRKYLIQKLESTAVDEVLFPTLEKF